MSKYVFVNDGYTVGNKVYMKNDSVDESELPFVLTRAKQIEKYGKVFYVREDRFDDLKDKYEVRPVEYIGVTAHIEDVVKKPEEEEEISPKPKTKKQSNSKSNK